MFLFLIEKFEIYFLKLKKYENSFVLGMVELAETERTYFDLSSSVSSDLFGCNTKQMKFSDEYSQRKWDRECAFGWRSKRALTNFKANLLRKKQKLAVCILFHTIYVKKTICREKIFVFKKF